MKIIIDLGSDGLSEEEQQQFKEDTTGYLEDECGINNVTVTFQKE